MKNKAQGYRGEIQLQVADFGLPVNNYIVDCRADNTFKIRKLKYI